MIEEKPLLPYFEWLLQLDSTRIGALAQFVAVIAVFLVFTALVALLVGSVVYGPGRAGEYIYRLFSYAGRELFDLSFRRIGALTRLSMKEAWRGGRVVVVLAIFLVLLLFAGWFVKPDREPAKIFISIVLSATSYLGLFMALVLAVFSLPDDFKSRRIYTVVTKPVRAGEIILGRIFGFSLIGTLLLAVMGVASYAFVYRSLNHSHRLEMDNGQLVMTTDAGHRHEIRQGEDGEIEVAYEFGHDHTVTKSGDKYVVSAPQGMLNARRPEGGTLRFLDRQGVEKPRGISVGKEWSYRSFIEGGTLGAAIWTFDVSEGMLVDRGDQGQYLPLEIVVRVFRTHKGNINDGIEGHIYLQKPGGELKSTPYIFTAKDQEIDLIPFARKLTNADPPNNTIDLIDDLAVDGKVEVVVQCLKPGQYYGFAAKDCYIRLEDGSPLLNFVKAYLSIWIQMVLVIAIAVIGSTIVSGPIALLLTVGFIILGIYRDDFIEIAVDGREGGGPIESLVRLVTGMNMVSDFKVRNTGVEIMKGADDFIQACMYFLSYVVPDFSKFQTSQYIAYGFDIPWNLIAQQLTIGLAYVFGLSILGYFLLRSREVAK